MAANYIDGVGENTIIQSAEINLVAVLKPTLSIDGREWCWLYGDDLQNGVAGFGKSPYLAALDFNRAFYAELPVHSPPLPRRQAMTETVSDDLVERLRYGVDRLGGTGWDVANANATMDEAACEIERLRADLTRYIDIATKEATEAESLRAERDALAKALEGARADTKRLDALRNESWDLRCFDMMTGGDDGDIGWKVVGHWMAQPTEREVAVYYGDNPRAAIDAASQAIKGDAP